MGVEVETIQMGDGFTYPKNGQTVIVHYTVREAPMGQGSIGTRSGWSLLLDSTCLYDGTRARSGQLPEGTVFDSSRKRGMPFTFRVGAGEVIKGWDEGIKKMCVGQRAKLTCSPDYAYGSKGYPGVIPPNTPLVFDIELISLQ